MNQLIKTLFLSFAVFGLFLTSTAHPVDQQTAKAIAAKFMQTNDLQLSTTYQTDKGIATFYVFNTSDGFVIVAADDCETPIIAYSRESRFDPNNVPMQMEGYLQDFVARMQIGIENHIEADELTAKQWELVKTTGRLNERKDAKAVEPLLTEKWHQGCRYNSLCPEMSGPCNRAEVGCVAVAMGQIMHYWGYPASGWGSNAYYNLGVQLSADFGNTTYDWEHMPDSLTDASSEEEIAAVATLLYHCGVAVNMEYSNNGSNISSANVPNALIRYFSYSRQLHRDKKGNDNAAWLAKLKDCLDLQRPIYYSGKGNAGGHAFVCDGYDDNDLLHFNWGWGGNGDGYFALGNLNVIGYHFNNNNYAILDIFPQYEPCMVTATAFPATAGSIEGTGEYHLGAQCTLTAVPTESSKFSYWKKEGRIISQEPSVTFNVENDIDGYEAYFSFKPLKEIIACHAPDTNDVNSPNVYLSWDFDGINEWNLLKQFETDWEASMVATDGEHIYTAYDHFDNYPYTFSKYTMDGELLEHFNIEGARPDGMTCDGSFFYCSKNHSINDICYMYRFDFDNKTLIDSTYMNKQFSKCAYDANYDGFWLRDYLSTNRNISLVNRQGETICGFTMPSTMGYLVEGFGGILAEDGNPHLLLSYGRVVFDYDINTNNLNVNPISLLNFYGNPINASFAQYDGKDAIFITHADYSYNSFSISIFEINSHLAPILHYRLYRADSEGNTVMLADEVDGTSFIDSTWNEATPGMYRFGISEVYFNGVESEIIWSDTIKKSGIGIEENDSGQEAPEPSVRKVIEDGHLIIIKDGKRYSVTGQQLN